MTQPHAVIIPINTDADVDDHPPPLRKVNKTSPTCPRGDVTHSVIVIAIQPPRCKMNMMLSSKGKRRTQ